jgi:hypothetical protein
MKAIDIAKYIDKASLPTTTGLVQQPVQIVVRYRSHNLTLFVRRITRCPGFREGAIRASVS